MSFQSGKRKKDSESESSIFIQNAFMYQDSVNAEMTVSRRARLFECDVEKDDFMFLIWMDLDNHGVMSHLSICEKVLTIYFRRLKRFVRWEKNALK